MFKLSPYKNNKFKIFIYFSCLEILIEGIDFPFYCLRDFFFFNIYIQYRNSTLIKSKVYMCVKFSLGDLNLNPHTSQALILVERPLCQGFFFFFFLNPDPVAKFYSKSKNYKESLVTIGAILPGVDSI